MIDVFIPPSDFSGDDNHRPVAPIKLGGGQATYNGQIVFANMSRKKAEMLLPALKLTLAANTGAHPDVHPVFHLHGMQTQTDWIINGQQQPVGSDYGEFMLLIPFVQIDGGPQWYNFAARMYLNDPGAVLLGLYFGYRKILALVDMHPSTFDANLFDPANPFQPKPLFHSEHHPNLSATAQQLPNWPDMQWILSMPILGINEGTVQKLGSYFRLDFTNASVSPVDCSHSYKPAFAPSIQMGSMTKVKDGAVDVAGVVWQIDFPAIPLP